MDDRDRIITLLHDSFRDPLMRLGARIEDCCSCPGIWIDEQKATVQVREMRCRSRLCPLCRESISRKYMARAIELMSQMDAPKLLTLTIVSSDRSLSEQILHLKESFARLRRHKNWKKHVAGGVATFEITFNRKRQQWHPHLHAIIDSTYWNKLEIRSAWEQATGDSSIIDIRKVNSKAGAASYIAKYVSKSNNAAEFPDERIAEWASEVRSLRFFTTFGSMHALKIEDPDDDDGDETNDPRYAASPGSLLKAAANGDDYANGLYRQVKQLVQRRVPLPDAPAFTEHQTRVCELARRLRSWQRHFEKGGSGEPPDESRAPPGNDRPRDRQLWIGENLPSSVACRSMV